MVSNGLSLLSLGFYTLGSVLGLFYLGTLQKGRVIPWLFPGLLTSVGLGLASYGLWLAWIGIQVKACPIVGPFGATLFLGNITVLVLLLFQFIHRFSLLLVVGLPLTTLLVGVGQLVFPPRSLVLKEAAERILVPFHILFLSLGYVALIVGALSGFLYVSIYYTLKHKALLPGEVHMPSLSWMDRLNRQSLSMGFLLYSLGLFIGFLALSMEHPSHPWILDPLVLMSFVLWIFYLGLLLYRWKRGFCIHSVAYLSILLMGVMFFTYFVASLIWKGFHRL